MQTGLMCYEGGHGLAHYPSALRSGELSREQRVPGKGESCSFPCAPSQHPLAECCTLPATRQESSPLGHQAMKGLWLGKYEQNRANFVARLDLGGRVGKVRNGWMGRLEKQCQLQICHPHLTLDIELVSKVMSSCT